MARRRRAEVRSVLPDSRTGSIEISKFINTIMVNSKKSVAEKIVHGALDQVQLRSGKPGLEVFEEALQNIRPEAEVRSRRVGGATYQVPMEVRSSRAQALTFRWLAAAARARSEPTMRERLANEILDASRSRGAAVKKRDDTHRMAEANRAFAHYRW